jgi:hypothetical protein
VYIYANKEGTLMTIKCRDTEAADENVLDEQIYFFGYALGMADDRSFSLFNAFLQVVDNRLEDEFVEPFDNGYTIGREEAEYLREMNEGTGSHQQNHFSFQIL